MEYTLVLPRFNSLGIDNVLWPNVQRMTNLNGIPDTTSNRNVDKTNLLMV